MKLLLASCVALALVCGAQAVSWAVLVAGSNTWGNYRHQSDICHAYQIAAKGGISADRIIVFQFDDLANSRSNPYPGQVFNKPTPVGTPGVDVYKGCQKDYVGNAVTATNVINVLTGNAEAMKGIGNGKVLKSGPNDNVFFFYSDHGTVGEVEMPTGGPLYATKFNQAIQLMHSRNMYKRMVVYIESCESGSMFNNLLPKNIAVYGTSASSPDESSWGCYCPPQDKVNGKSINSCLGDLYSVNWMEDTDKFGKSRSLQDQFVAVRTLTTMSKVMQWGDTTFTNLTVGEFQGEKTLEEAFAAAMEPEVDESAEFSGAEGWSKEELREMSAVRTYDIPMHLSYYNYLRFDKTASLEESHRLVAELQSELTARVVADKVFSGVANKLAADAAQATELFNGRNKAPIDFNCLAAAKQSYVRHCGEWSDYSRQYVRVLNNLCLAGVSPSAIDASVDSLC